MACAASRVVHGVPVPELRQDEAIGSLNLDHSDLGVIGAELLFCGILSSQNRQSPPFDGIVQEPLTQRQGGSGMHGKLDTSPCVLSVYYRLVRISLRALVPTLERCWYTLFLQCLQIGVGTFLQQPQEVLVRVPTAASGGVGTHHDMVGRPHSSPTIAGLKSAAEISGPEIS